MTEYAHRLRWVVLRVFWPLLKLPSLALGLTALGFALAATLHQDDLRIAYQYTIERIRSQPDPEIDFLGWAGHRFKASMHYPQVALSAKQEKVATYLAKRYRVGRAPIRAVVLEAYATARVLDLDPTLLLAVIAVESSFNPYAVSPVGAQGLTQVMTRVHQEKFADFGGVENAFDMKASIRVGAFILKRYLRLSRGNHRKALARYLGAVNSSSNAYVKGVNALWTRLRGMVELPKPAAL